VPVIGRRARMLRVPGAVWTLSRAARERPDDGSVASDRRPHCYRLPRSA
jgi:hypothetical protein